MRLKSTLWQKLLIAVLLCVTCLSLAPPVEASTYRVNLLVLYDEEWAHIAIWQYAYSAEELAHVMVNLVHRRFYEEFAIGFRIVDYQSYDSDDSLTDVYERYDEMLSEVNSSHSFNVVVAFTGQLLMYGENEVYGIGKQSDGAVLASYRYVLGVGQATDRILQHEITHLYGIDYHHYKADFECVMNLAPTWIGFPYYYPVLTCVTTDIWCSGCKQIISANRGAWGRAYTGGGGGGSWPKLIRPEGEVREV